MIDEELAKNIGKQFCRNCEAAKETAFINAFVQKYFQKMHDNFDLFELIHE